MNSSGQLIFLSSLSCIILCLITQHWIYSSSLPIYFPILWAFVVTILSTWISCIIFKHIIKADSSITLHPISIYLRKKFDFYIQSRFLLNRKKLMKNNNNDNNDDKNKGEINFSININNKKEDELSSENLSGKIVNEIDNKFIQIWYENISDDKQFSQEAKNLILKLSLGLNERIKNVEKIQIVDKLAGVLIVHLKEYRRAVRRVEKGNAGTIEEAYNYSHPGSRSSAALEHTLGRLVTVIAREFLQWELGSSLPCKLLLSILARRLMSVLETISSPKWILQHLVHQLNTKTEVDGKIENSTVNNAKEVGIIPTALSDGIASATAAAIARPLTKPNFIKLPEVRIEESNNFHESQKNSPQHFHEPIEHTAQHRRGLWGDGVGVNSEIEIELDEDRISPIYEEPTDFASTIARLRNLLQQKSTATTPLQVEEKFGFCDLESPFTNISIPRIESYFSAEGSQQILYCIQFDDVEQRGVYTFETTCTTTRRRYSDFVQLHASLEEFPGLRELMSDIVLPEGGRSEMENYLKTICSRLGNEAPNILRRFLRPDSGIGKKADIVTPRFDRFLAKTVSGVFNTLKTVVPGFEMEQQEEENPFFQPMLMSLADVPWRFVQDVSLNKNFAQDLRQLVADRTDYCSVDTAYEAVDSVEGSGDSELLAHWLEIMNRSCDVDELDTNLSLTCAGIDLACEILSGVNKSRSFQHEGFIKCFKLIFGNITEPIIQDIVCLAYDCCEALPVSSSLADKECDETLLDLQLKIQSCLEKSIPTVVKLFFSENDIKDMIKFTIGSLEVKKINRDLNLQILDVIASQILASCRSTHLKI
ncbi:uncharacterized protein LOC122498679 isoform X3 [Leptopilina heterotoma]|uniref:uncharacterized protein LOC122498679 isoform X3 n=1 Tax=Leptopilina heterotoma TaxID=63436 RepID=UPI001CA8A06A|nr:uncharacterized protein LOC122498679 isoform X3 [Leptopilina heterotoma]